MTRTGKQNFIYRLRTAYYILCNLSSYLFLNRDLIMSDDMEKKYVIRDSMQEAISQKHHQIKRKIKP